MIDRAIDIRRSKLRAARRRWRAHPLCVLAVLCWAAAGAHAGPLPSGRANPSSFQETVEQLRSPANPAPSGLYALESGIAFNTLDAVNYDASSGRISLVGHFDRRFIGPSIPYLQHLAALLEAREPHFSLETTPASNQNLKARLASSTYSRQKILSHFSEIFDERGFVTWFGRAVLSSLGLSPIQGHRPPGFFGAEVEALPSGAVRVRSLLAGSPADDADMKAGDEIIRFDGKAPTSVAGFARLVRFAGAGNKVAISYLRKGRPAEVSIALIADPESDPWHQVTRSDVDALLPASGQGQRTVVDRLRDFASSSPAGFQIPPELVESLLGARPESVPEYFGESSNSQLARLMFEADYTVLKPLGHRADLKERIPGYQTWFDYAALHPKSRTEGGSKRIWISVGKMDVAQSASGTTLAIRDVKMRFNIRNQGAGGQDAPTPPDVQGYGDILTKLYDELAQDYFPLHELREAAKLAAAAHWIRQKTPSLRLPAEGRVAWHGPARVPGMIFMQIPSKGGDDTWLIPHGGVNLTPFPPGPRDRIFVIPMDTRAPELSDLPRLKAPQMDAGRSAISSAFGKPGNDPPDAGWTRTTRIDGRLAGTATVVLSRIGPEMAALRDAPNDNVRVRAKASVDEEERKLRAEIARDQDKVDKAGDMLKLAWLLHEKGNDAEAIALVKQARTLAPSHPLILLLQAALEEGSGNRREAINKLKDYVKLDPNNAPAKAMLARLQAEELHGITTPSTAPSAQPGRGTALGQLQGMADYGTQQGRSAITAAGGCMDGSQPGCLGRPPPFPQLRHDIPKINPKFLNDPKVQGLLGEQYQNRQDMIEYQGRLNEIDAKKRAGVPLTADDQKDATTLPARLADTQQKADDTGKKLHEFELVD